MVTLSDVTYKHTRVYMYLLTNLHCYAMRNAGNGKTKLPPNLSNGSQ